MSLLQLLGKGIDYAAKFIVRVTVGLMAVTVFVQVIWRYFLDSPIIWAEELARYCLVWMTFIGASVALRAGQLAVVDIFIAKLPSASRKVIQILADVLSLALIAFLFYEGLKIIGLPSVTLQKSPSLRMPMNLIYLCIPIGLGFLLIQQIIQLINNLKSEEVNER